MAWAFEFKAASAWTVAIVLLMVVAMWAEVQTASIVPLLIPILAYMGFAAWVFKGVKK